MDTVHYNIVVDWPDGDSQIIECSKPKGFTSYQEAVYFKDAVIQSLRADGSDAYRITIIAGERIYL